MKSKTSLHELVRRTKMALAGNWWGSVAVIAVVGVLIGGVGMLYSGAFMLPMLQGINAKTVSLVAVSMLPLIVFSGPLCTGVFGYFLSIARKENPGFRDMFQGFDHFGGSVGVFWLTGLLYFLWCLALGVVVMGLFLLLMVGGGAAMTSLASADTPAAMLGTFALPLLFVIAWLVALFWVVSRHSLIFLAYIDKPGMGAVSAVKRGISLVSGNYKRLFCVWGMLLLFSFLLTAVMGLLMFLLSLQGFVMIAGVLNAVFGVCFSFIIYIFIPAFLAVLYEDIKSET